VTGGGGYVTSPEALPDGVWDGAWHYAVGTYDGERVRLFVDGSEVGHGTAAGLAIRYGLGSPGAFLGAYRGGCNLPLTGEIDEIAVRDRALGPAEIAALAEEAARRPVPPPLPPVAGPPATGRSGPPDGSSGSPPQGPRSCFQVRVTPGSVVVHRATRLRIVVRRHGRAATGVHVTVGGLGLRASAQTRRRGRAKVVVRSRRSGRLRVTVRGQPRGCAVRLLAVRPKPGG
jgi:Concanavalin A-like lectin/glucanases superfamily